MLADGFPELARCWKDFCDSRKSLESLDDDAVEQARCAHLAPLFGSPAAVGAAAVAGTLGVRAVLGSAVDDMTRPLPTAAQPIVEAGWYANVALLLVAGAVAIQRYAVNPFRRVMAQQTASMLRQSDFRAHVEAGSRATTTQRSLEAAGINDTWDNPAYAKAYRLNKGEPSDVKLESAAEITLHTLRSILGYKDEEARRHIPGQLTPALSDGKRTVTEIVKTFGEQIALAKTGNLPPKEAANLFEVLAAKHCKSEGEAARFLRGQAALLQNDRPLVPTQAVRADVWERNPWVDLTSQKEFFSSASLRSSSLFESGSKGRLGTFGYLLNPSMCCLDFSTGKGRAVRTRMLATKTSTPEGDVPLLFVDGIEGTNSVAIPIIKKGVEDYARECGFHAVLYNAAVHNKTPQRFVQTIAQTGAPRRELTIEAFDATTREYLDAFGLPIQPFEYQHPRGRVCGYLVPLKESAAHLGTEETLGGKTKRLLQKNLLYIFYADAIGIAAVSSAQVSSLMTVGILALGAAGLTANHWYQGRSARAGTAPPPPSS